ncbi:TIGR03746 family integrating conjugative element protein [Pokkaliibacter sp. MBI-7]|uniref:PFL_4703 family integrating conjugative element protein n=1 Tax=Pokkaliibacter sp. MBI-7 TaxID=3040600 RepID=UPI00244950CC|nr:TIGR03746 family integrating conjugative element protein [Pokkaliibacter sp. MBI-7]MDH2436664.1 TIGR03746 family integrating conjugative element protein [Pokkaliibacter sp. MBI-7]
MSRHRTALSSRDSHITSLRLVIALLAAFAGFTSWGWYTAPRHLTVHNPPDLRSGSTRAWWEVPPSTVYSFAFYIFQQLNYWPRDGESDYHERIETLRAYLTPSCKAWLDSDYERRKVSQELTDRVRSVAEIPGRGVSDDRVHIQDRDHWVVDLELMLTESVHGESVKKLAMLHPLKVVRWDMNPETNPFGLALDCYDSLPERLDGSVMEEVK